VRTLKVVFLAVLACGALGLPVEAQTSLPISLFERYLEALRQQVKIPGISGIIVQEGQVVWDRGFGYQDVEASVAARADTPYPILDLTQTLSSTVLLRLRITTGAGDRVVRWNPNFRERHHDRAALSHASPAAVSSMTRPIRCTDDVLDQCANRAYPRLGRAVVRSSGHVLVPDRVPRLIVIRAAVVRRHLARYAVVVSGLCPTNHSRGHQLYGCTGDPMTAGGGYSTVRSTDSTALAGVLPHQTLSRVENAGDAHRIGLFSAITVNRVWHFGLKRDANSPYREAPSRGLT
jgi:hypothetical protein